MILSGNALLSGYHVINWRIMASLQRFHQGFLHRPDQPSGIGVVLTHGAGGDCNGRLLVSVSDALCAAGYFVLRFDLPFRLARRSPHPSRAGEDREALREAAARMREIAGGRVVLGGHSYGGRQASMLVAEDPTAADMLLLLSYPLHPPRVPDKLRTEHLPRITTPALFVHGTKDPFGSIEEMRAAMKLLSGPAVLSEVPGAAHDLKGGKFDIGELLLKPLAAVMTKQAA
jgi:predicted alpha/beta-hydrolase family hydrolase